MGRIKTAWERVMRICEIEWKSEIRMGYFAPRGPLICGKEFYLEIVAHI